MYGWGATPPNEEHVRSTVTVVDNDAPSAVQADVPDFNELEVDPDTGGGLTERNLASFITPGQQGTPIPSAYVNDNPNDIVNNSISSSGTAAEREAAGQWGHGTLTVVEGIEPTIRDGQAFGETYFHAPKPPVQAPAGDFVSPAVQADRASLMATQATATDNARQAASPYTTFLNNTTSYAPPE
jgi:hypothetical protein